MAKSKKKPSKKDEPLKVYGSFEDLIKVSVRPPFKAITPPKETPKKEKKGSK